EHYYTAVHNSFELYHRTKDEQYLERGFYFSEKSKAMLLLTSLRENLAKVSNQIPDSLLKKQDYYKSEIAQLKKTIYDLEQNQVASDSIDIWRNICFKKENELDALTDNLKEKYPDFFKIKYNTQVATIEEIQAYLPDDNTALVTYFFGGDWFPIIKITKNNIQSHFKPFDQKIKTRIRSLIDLVNDNQRAEAKGGDLKTYQTFVDQSSSIYQFLFAELIQPTDEKLIIVPDGLTAFLPFEILLNKSADSTQINYTNLPYLLKDHTIRQAYSATLLLQQDNYKKNGQGLLAYAPQYVPAKNKILATRDGFTALKFTQEEVAHIASVSNGIALTKDKATERSFKEKAGDAKILHLAMHAFSNDKNPDYSGLIFTKTLDSLEDDILHAYELYNMNLKAELAVLSACNTGAGKLAKGEGVMSLARAFRHAGCPNIVMSLWQADDEATAQIMQDFYKNLKAGVGKDDALRNAKLSYLASSPKTFPHYWSAFVLMGDGEGVDFGNTNWLWILGFVGVLLVIVFLIRRK
ncbi:MAG: CHAT domain-containing protein, partial [Bacteroidota bacterium]